VPKTSSEIEAQIAKLQRDLEAAKAKEVKDVIGRMRAAIAHYGLTAEDLFGERKRGKRGVTKATAKKVATKAGPKSRRAGVKVPVKFKDAAGNTWTGRGSMPRWLKAAVADGKRAEDFRIAP